MGSESGSGGAGIDLEEVFANGGPLARLAQLGAFFYVLGFIVIMVNTSGLNIPVIEALRIQSILAGLPIGLVIILVFLLWPKLFVLAGGRETITKFVILTTVALLATPLILGEVGLLFGRFSIWGNELLTVGILVALSISFYISAHDMKFERGKAFAKTLGVYSLLMFLVVLYGTAGYPNVPQSVGGGHPAKVRLYLKNGEIAALLGGATASNENASVSGTVYLYYRTSDFLLISKEQKTDQPLIQIPMEQVHAVVWLESRSQ